jgi:2-oxo-3-hexenedioate decarboxylase
VDLRLRRDDGRDRMTGWTVEEAATILLEAEHDRCDRAPLTDSWPGLDPATAYEIQRVVVAAKVAQGERVVGLKLGLTSAAKQQQMGVTSPLTAWRTDAMEVEPGGKLSLSSLIHPRIEPEIVFMLGSRLEGPGITAETAMAAVATTYAGLEVVDSRFTDYRFKLPDVIADNASSAVFTVGNQDIAPAQIDLASEQCQLLVNGSQVGSATGEAVMGHPANALALAANELAASGQALEAGWIVLTGGLTDAVAVSAGDVVEARFGQLGTVKLTVG